MSNTERLEYALPRDIETRSFQIIEEELGPHGFDPQTALVVKRVIHATADFDFAKNLHFSERAVQDGVAALKSGAHVVADTTMVAAGINKRVLSSFGGSVHVFVADDDVAREARERGTTRSAVSMERAARLKKPLVFAIGNAPTALLTLHRLLCDGSMPTPTLVVGVPVGFVNVVESKELIMGDKVEHIVSRGRKGGSTVAAAIVNALLYLASNDRRW